MVDAEAGRNVRGALIMSDISTVNMGVLATTAYKEEIVALHIVSGRALYQRQRTNAIFIHIHSKAPL